VRATAPSSAKSRSTSGTGAASDRRPPPAASILPLGTPVTVKLKIKVTPRKGHGCGATITRRTIHAHVVKVSQRCPVQARPLKPAQRRRAPMADERALLELIAGDRHGVLAAMTRAGYPHLTNVLYVCVGRAGADRARHHHGSKTRPPPIQIRPLRNRQKCRFAGVRVADLARTSDRLDGYAAIVGEFRA
jgi:hypothetical protein